MKILMEEILRDYEGKEILEKIVQDGKEVEEKLTVRDVFVRALNTFTKDEIQIAEQKNKIFQISLKLYKSKEVDFTVDDLAFIKDRVGKVYNALVFGRISEIMEGKKADEETVLDK